MSETISILAKVNTNTTNKIFGKAIVKNLPPLFANKGFNNFVCEGKLKEIREKCWEFAKDETEKKSLVLCGKVGSGKTHLAIAVIRNAATYFDNETKKLSKGICEFVNANEFFTELNEKSTNYESKLDAIKKYLSNDILLLDDLGINNFTPAKQENLYLLINRAYLFQRRIIITTNFLMEDFDQFDKRIASRLSEMAHILVFDFPDYRKK